jgi:hypothetical protein
MAVIFICYRRDDSQGQAGRLYDSLVAKFGERNVFFDVDNLHPGADFDSVIQSTLGRSKVVLVVIGPRWLSSRIANDQDFVRKEILAALKGRTRVIPILVGGAQMPRPDQLPADLKALLGKNAVVLEHRTWKDNVASLIRSLEKFLARTKPSGNKSASGAPKKTVAKKTAARGKPAVPASTAPRKRAPGSTIAAEPSPTKPPKKRVAKAVKKERNPAGTTKRVRAITPAAAKPDTDGAAKPRTSRKVGHAKSPRNGASK